MKKLLSIALVLVFALSFAAPALAYTDITDGGTNPFEADIYLVDYSSTVALFGGAPSLSLPATNRAYGVNEIVAAVASFTVPKNTDILETYGKVAFTSENISMFVSDNYNANNFRFINDITKVAGNSVGTFTDVASDEVVLDLDAANALINESAKAQKYSFLVFGKILDDEAELSVELQRGAGFASMTSWLSLAADRLEANSATPTATFTSLVSAATSKLLNQFVVLNDDYIVYTSGADGAERVYVVSDHPDDNTVEPKPLLVIEVGKNNATAGVLYFDGATPYRFYMTAGGDIVINNASTGDPATVATTPSLYNKLLNGFNALFEDLGLTLSNRTNVMKNSFWTNIANSANIKETVTIDPLALPYIQVPEVEVTEPPKTGSAASIVGFVVIAMAGLAAAAVRKVRA